jgi:hypothetical protein
MPSAIESSRVTATNFQEPPHSAWGFHHVRELHPTAKVWRGAGPVMTLGAFGQSVFVDPDAELVIAKLSCFAPDKEDALFDDMFRAFHAIARAFAPVH